MMQMLVLLSDRVHDDALATASDLGRALPFPPDVLHAPLDDESSGRIAEIWDAAEGALNRAYHTGLEAARPLLDRVAGLLARLTAGAVQRADEIERTIKARIAVYVRESIDGALQSVRPSIDVGGRQLMLSSVTLQQRIAFSGSAAVALTKACEFAASGEISLSAAYADQAATRSGKA